MTEFFQGEFMFLWVDLGAAANGIITLFCLFVRSIRFSNFVVSVSVDRRLAANLQLK